MKKTFKLIAAMPSIAVAALVAVIGFSIIACDNGGGGGEGGGGGGGDSGGNTGGNTGGTVVRFNLTGAKAIAAAQGGSGSGRAVNGSGNGLFKLLENGSFESIVSGNNEIPAIQFLARSPVEGKKDIYISFWDGAWGAGGRKINSTLVHVKEDGSVVNILESWDSFLEEAERDTSPVVFDRYGNMYFRVHGSSHSNSIYKYNPVTGKKEQLVPAVSNIFYRKIAVSPDGSYLIVDGNQYKSGGDVECFTRIIPTANPQNMVEQIIVVLTYHDDGSLWGYGISLAYAFGQRNELYVSGEKIFGDENKNGVYKVSYEGLSPNEWQWEKLFDAQEKGYNFGSIFILFVAPDNSVWGNNGSIARIINSNEQPDFYQATDSYDPMLTPNGLRADVNIPFKPSASHLYFEMFTGDNVGYNNIYRVSYNNPSSAQNVFSGITRNTQSMYVINFDIGGDYLYFSAVEDPLWTDTGLMGDFFNGKINLTTLEYTELEFSWKITALVTY